MHTSYGSILFIAASCVLVQTCAQSVADNVIDGKLFIQLNSIINQLETISRLDLYIKNSKVILY